MSSSADPVLTTALTYRDSADSWHASTPTDRAAWLPSYDRFFAMLPTGQTVLDLGCGSGEDVPEFQRRGVSVIGLDISKELLDLASEQSHVAGRLVVADIRHLPFADASLGGVWADGSLHHITKSDFRETLHDVSKALVSGGCLAFSVERGTGEGFMTDTEVAGPRWYARYELAELSTALIGAGFEVIDHLVGEPSGYSPGGFLVMFARNPK